MDWLLPFRQIFGFALPLLDRLPIIRAILGFIIVFFLPGFAWTFIFFKKLHPVERAALSFGLSIASVTLSIIAPNVLFGMKITTFHSLVVILTITIVPVPLYYLLKYVKTRPGSSPEEEN